MPPLMSSCDGVFYGWIPRLRIRRLGRLVWSHEILISSSDVARKATAVRIQVGATSGSYEKELRGFTFTSLCSVASQTQASTFVGPIGSAR